VAYGLLEPVEWVGPESLFDAAAVPRLQIIMRLRLDTGVNLAGIGMILDMLDRLRALERENQWLRAQQ
jgi:DNA-binding transcriptional MerR regulator